MEFSFLKSGHFFGLVKFWLMEQSFLNRDLSVKFMFSKKDTKMDEIFTVDLTVITYCQIEASSENVNFKGQNE